MDTEIVSERCPDCGHFLDVHDDNGCLAFIESSTDETRPCRCTEPGRQTVLL